MNRGKLVIVLMLSLAVGLTGYAWWFHYRQSHRVVEQWGSPAARLIRRGEQVWLLRLAPERSGAATEVLDISATRFAVTERKDISRAAGLIHIRHFLAEDAYYEWDAPADNCQPRWSYAIRFARGEEQLTLVFDRRCQQVMLLPGETTLRLGAVIQRLEEFIDAL